MKEIQVSIICNAYNHERYIRDALEGFVKQKTSFDYEVLIHDDASTDHTADIIREYEVLFPDIIKPIYQKENQYSKKIPVSASFQYPRVKGKYVAFCEGDDYWIDYLKLQKQFDAMEAHPEVDICAHASITISASDGKEIRKNIRLEKEGLIPTKAVIEGGGGFVASSSVFYRSDLLNHMPLFRQIYGLDYATQVHGALRGGMYYFSDIMSVYRAGVPDSATQRLVNDISKRIIHGNIMYHVLEQMDKDTDQKYHKSILRLKLRNRFRQIALYCIRMINKPTMRRDKN